MVSMHIQAISFIEANPVNQLHVILHTIQEIGRIVNYLCEIKSDGNAVI